MMKKPAKPGVLALRPVVVAAEVEEDAARGRALLVQADEVEERILRSLRAQLQQGLLSLPEYEAAARNAVKALGGDRRPVRLDGEGSGTLRLVLSNTKRQLDMGLISPAQALKLKQAAVQAKVASGLAFRCGVPDCQQAAEMASRTQLQGQQQGRSKSPRSGADAEARRAVSPRAKLEASVEAPQASPYTPFVSPGAAHCVATEQVTAAISLELDCCIVGSAPKERKTRMGLLKQCTAFVVKITSRRGSLEFTVLRRYAEFLQCHSELAEMWPDVAWPVFPRKSSVDYSDAAAVQRLQSTLDAFLRQCCKHAVIVRSAAFVAFIDPKSNPTLAQLGSLVALAGWVEHRRLGAASNVITSMLESSVWRPRLWAAVAKGRLYLYPDRALQDCEPLLVLPVHLCCVDLDAATGVVTVERWCVGQALQLRVPRGQPLEPVALYRQLRHCNSDAAHARFVRLLSQEDANILHSATEEAIRKVPCCSSVLLMAALTALQATLVSSGPPRLQPSLSAAYYEPDTAANVLMERGALRAGTPVKLVEKLLDARLCPQSAVVGFLLTYHSYLAPMQLLDQLMSYYRKGPDTGPAAADGKAARALRPEQLRVVAIVQRWVTVNPHDFQADRSLCVSLQSWVMALPEPALRLKLVALINRMVFHEQPSGPVPAQQQQQRHPPAEGESRPRPRKSSLGSAADAALRDAQPLQGVAPSPAQTLQLDSSGTVRLAAQPQQQQQRRRGDIPWPQPRPERAAPSRSRSSSSAAAVLPLPAHAAAVLPPLFPDVAWDALALDPLELARQLALQHFDFFKRIKVTELLEQRWSKPAKLLEAPNVCAWIELFNVLSGMVSTTVVKVDDGRERAGVVLRWIHIAFECFQLNNFACVCAIMCALLNSAVHRLRRTWAMVRSRSPERHQQFERLAAVVSSDRNYAVQRGLLRAAQPPLLPYLGLFLQDLTFIDEGNRNTLEPVPGGPVQLVSFEKRLSYAAVLQDIMLWQSVGFTSLKPIPAIQDYLKRFNPLNSDKLYARSLILEPRERQ